MTYRREVLEFDLKFLGFLIFANQLKPVSKNCIKQLHEGGVDTIMATGDNILTAVSVARK